MLKRESLQKEQHTFRLFTLMYLVALIAIAIISVVSQLLIQTYLSNHLDDSHVLNYAAKLRTYSQSLSKTALLLERGTEPETNKKEFLNTLKQWEKLHQGLISGISFLNLPANDRVELEEMYSIIQDPYQEIMAASYNILHELESRASFEEVNISPYIEQILKNEKAYFLTMELIVFDYDRFSRNNVVKLKKIEFWLLSIVLLTLLLEVIFIFYPLSRMIRKIIAGLSSSETHALKLASELKEANHSLESSLKELRETTYALEKATCMVKTDAGGKILYANDNYCHLSRYSGSELNGKPLFHHLPGQEESIIYSHIKDEDRRKEVWQGEVFDHAADGTGFWLDVTLIPIIDNKGKVYQYLMVSNDISQRKNTERELQLLMQEQLIAKSQEQKLKSYSILAGQEKERKRVAAEIHDGIGQMLTGMRMRMEMLVTAHPELEKDTKAIHSLLQSIIDETRRICANLLPSVLDDFGLQAAMQELLSNIEEDTGITIKAEEELDPQYLNKELEIGIYRILQESLNNVVKHAHAKAVIVKLTNNRDSLSLHIQDEGKGFNYEETKLYVQDMARKNNGLRIMKERAEMIGGKLRILSASGTGTTIQLDIAL